MNELLEISSQITETQSALERIQRSIKERPKDPTLQLMASSLEKRQLTLEDRFLQVTGAAHIDVCSYRLFSEKHSHYSIHAIGGALKEFQTWFTRIYDALTNGVKDKSRVPLQTIELSQLAFAYTFSGSLGVAMTLPVERLLIENELEIAMRVLTDMLAAESSDQIHYFAKKFGSGTIRTMAKWVDIHASSDLGADIRWMKGNEEIASYTATTSHLANLLTAIKETSDITEELLNVTGFLVGANINKHTFHMVFADQEEVRGTMADTIGAEFAVELPRRYVAQIRKSSYENFATDQTVVKYHLENLAEA